MEDKKASDLTVEQKVRQEGQKLLYDACKHLTTLNTGAILILATFLEKFFRQDREWVFLIAVVFIALIFSMICSVITMLTLSEDVFYLREATETGTRTGKISIIISVSTFIIGIIGLVVFVLKNFY